MEALCSDIQLQNLYIQQLGYYKNSYRHVNILFLKSSTFVASITVADKVAIIGILWLLGILTTLLYTVMRNDIFPGKFNQAIVSSVCITLDFSLKFQSV